MRAYQFGVMAALAAMGSIGAATAAPCYVIFDRNDVVIFRDEVPPFDLSDPKSAERAALRQRGQHLLIAEFEKCNPVGYISSTTGGTTATVDEIVMQLRPAIATSIGSGSTGYVTSASPGGGGASVASPTARAARPAPRPAY